MRPLITLPAAVLLSGCGTIFNGATEPVQITSTAPDASFTITDHTGKQVATGRAGETVRLDNGGGYMMPGRYTIQMSAPGYADATAQAKADFSGWYLGNILIGGALGMLVVDPLTGGMWAMPDEINVPMRRASAATGGATTAPLATTAMAAPAVTTRYGRDQFSAEKAAGTMGCTDTTLAAESPGLELYTASCAGTPVSIRCEWGQCAAQ